MLPSSSHDLLHPQVPHSDTIHLAAGGRLEDKIEHSPHFAQHFERRTYRLAHIDEDIEAVLGAGEQES